MTSTSADYLRELLEPEPNDAPLLYTEYGVSKVRVSSTESVRRAAWRVRKHPKLAIHQGIYLQPPNAFDGMDWLMSSIKPSLLAGACFASFYSRRHGQQADAHSRGRR
jgi:hypothetical protein